MLLPSVVPDRQQRILGREASPPHSTLSKTPSHNHRTFRSRNSRRYYQFSPYHSIDSDSTMQFKASLTSLAVLLLLSPPSTASLVFEKKVQIPDIFKRQASDNCVLGGKHIGDTCESKNKNKIACGDKRIVRLVPFPTLPHFPLMSNWNCPSHRCVFKQPWGGSGGLLHFLGNFTDGV